MDNQHKYIDGYRDLSKQEIDIMNDIKRQGNSLGNFLENLKLNPDVKVDETWLELAKSNLQVGLMAAVRAVAQPTSF